MRLLAFIFITLSFSSLFAYNYPARKGAINDYEDVLSKFSEQRFEKKLNRKKAETGLSLVLVTTSTFGDKSNSKDFLIELYKKWELKPSVMRDMVVLFISGAKNEVRLFVGKNIAGSFSKADRQKILDEVIRPQIYKRNFKAAIKKGIKAILKLI